MTLHSQPNLLVIMTDQQAADAMSCQIGHQHLNTPALDSLAKNGLVFNRAYCADPICVPSRASMVTGHYPHTTSVYSNDDSRQDLSAFTCLGRYFKEAGYDTGYVGKWHTPFPGDDPSIHGFNTFFQRRANGIDYFNNDEASKFLQQPRQNPFLLVVSYNNPHNICEWAREQRYDLPDGDLTPPPSLEACPPLRPNHAPQLDEPDILTLLRRSYHASQTFPVGNFGEAEWREYRWAYYRMVETVDARIGDLLRSLDAIGQRENTAIVFLSDHGDAQGSHRWNQKTILEDESSRVPFIVSYPARIQPGASNALVQTGIDLIPTLCDLAGLDAPADLPGSSALSQTTARRPYIVSCTRFVQGAPINGHKPEADGRMVRTPRYKYCAYDRGSLRESLVDMEQDPGETINLAPDPSLQKILQQHRRHLAQHCQTTHDPFPTLPIDA